MMLMSSVSKPCTTAIVSGKYTPDGRPLLWKHRDTDCLQNFIKYFNDGKYDYVALVNADKTKDEMVWVGYNSKGFAIMNNASYNLKDLNDTTQISDLEGVLMKKALMYCATISDFENMLDTLPKPLGVEANFGCIDAQGGAAYYETNNFKYFKIDANDPSIAPFGYIVKTNYSNYGKPDDGYGYIRYLAASELFYNAASTNSITPEFIIQEVSRSTTHALTKTNLKHEINNELTRFVSFEDYIPRYSTSASIVIQGVKDDEDAEMSTMWACVGWPFTAVTMPIWLKSKNVLPQMLMENTDGQSKSCNHSLILKEKAMPIKRGSGYKYMNVNVLFGEDGKGIVGKIESIDRFIFNETRKKLNEWMQKTPAKTELKNYYLWVDNFIKENYLSIN